MGLIAGLFGLLSSLGALLVSCFTFVFVIIVLWLMPAYAVYRMAKNKGIDFAWLAFIPLARCYLEVRIVSGEYNLFDWIKFQDRNKVALVYVLISVLGTSIAAALQAVPVFGQLLGTAYALAWGVMLWKKRYDLIREYRDDTVALVISLLDIVIPCVYEIYLFIIARTIPKVINE